MHCHTFITKSTVGLPIYRCRAQSEVSGEINRSGAQNAFEQRASILFAYAFGKAERILAGLALSVGPILTARAIDLE
jgi:putative mRNA 3-end processing factor